MFSYPFCEIRVSNLSIIYAFLMKFPLSIGNLTGSHIGNILSYISNIEENNVVVCKHSKSI